MDSLTTLPMDDSELSDEQQAVVDKYLGAGASQDTESSIEDSKWKIIGYITIILLLVINPWAQELMTKIPYVGMSKITIMGFTLLVFLILTIIVMYCLI